MRYLCVFCGSSLGVHKGFSHMARQLGQELVQQELGLVYGGGSIGLMGILASTVLQEGGKVIGVIPKHLAGEELLHPGLTTTHIVGSMHERKALMADLSSAFLTLPGGYGTLEECCEMMTWAQLNLHQKPCGLLNCFGFFDDLLAFFDHQTHEGFVTRANRQILHVAADPKELLRLLVEKMKPDVR